jgi:hypothetical protein
VNSTRREINAGSVFDALASGIPMQEHRDIADYITGKTGERMEIWEVRQGLSEIRENSIVYGYTVPFVKPGMPGEDRLYRLVAVDGTTSAEDMDALDDGYRARTENARTSARRMQAQAELAAKTAETRTDRRAARQQAAAFGAQILLFDAYLTEDEDVLV